MFADLSKQYQAITSTPYTAKRPQPAPKMKGLRIEPTTPERNGDNNGDERINGGILRTPGTAGRAKNVSFAPGFNSSLDKTTTMDPESMLESPCQNRTETIAARNASRASQTTDGSVAVPGKFVSKVTEVGVAEVAGKESAKESERDVNGAPVEADLGPDQKVEQKQKLGQTITQEQSQPSTEVQNDQARPQNYETRTDGCREELLNQIRRSRLPETTAEALMELAQRTDGDMVQRVLLEFESMHVVMRDMNGEAHRHRQRLTRTRTEVAKLFERLLVELRSAGSTQEAHEEVAEACRADAEALLQRLEQVLGEDAARDGSASETEELLVEMDLMRKELYEARRMAEQAIADREKTARKLTESGIRGDDAKALQDENRQLRETVARLQDEAGRASDAAARQVTAVSRELEAMTLERDAVLQEKEAIMRSRDAAERLHADYRRKTSVLTDERQALLERVSLLEQEVRGAHAQLDAQAKGENGSASSAETEALRREMARLERALAETEHDLNEQRAQAANARREAGELRQELAIRAAEARTNETRQAAKIADLERHTASLQRVLQARNRELEDATKHGSSMASSHGRLSTVSEVSTVPSENNIAPPAPPTPARATDEKENRFPQPSNKLLVNKRLAALQRESTTPLQPLRTSNRLAVPSRAPLSSTPAKTPARPPVPISAWSPADATMRDASTARAPQNTSFADPDEERRYIAQFKQSRRLAARARDDTVLSRDDTRREDTRMSLMSF